MTPSRKASMVLPLALALTADGCSSTSTDQAPSQSPYDREFARCKEGGGDDQACHVMAIQLGGLPPQVEVAALDDAGWAEHEAAARAALGPEGADATTYQISNMGFMVEQPLDLLGGHCYRAALSWPVSRATQASVMYVPNPDGTRVNERQGGHSAQLDESGGTIEFCADNAGQVNVHLSALEHGVIAQNTRLEYVLALTHHEETEDERAVRHTREEQEVAAAKAQIETNLQAADARKGGPAFATGCARCRGALYRCQDAPDADATTCQQQFELCAQPLGMDDRGRVLCASPM